MLAGRHPQAYANVMHILFDLLHLVAAAALSLIGFGYERDEDCIPVRFQPAAIVESAEIVSADTKPGEPVLERLQPIEDCEAERRAIRLPAL